MIFYRHPVLVTHDVDDGLEQRQFLFFFFELTFQFFDTMFSHPQLGLLVCHRHPFASASWAPNPAGHVYNPIPKPSTDLVFHTAFAPAC